CSGRSREPPKKRPPRNIALGNEDAWPNRTEHNDVEIAKMITHQQTGWRHWTAGGYANSNHATRKPAPAMQRRGARVKTLCRRKERNRDRILNECAEREKCDGKCAPDSK